MPTPFIMPKFDMDQETATVVEWLKNEGDPVEIDEKVLVVETDKVAIDVPAPAGGTLSRISVEPGDVVPVTSVIAYILAEGESEADLPAQDDVPSSPETVEPKPEHQPESPATSIASTPVAKRMAQELGIDLVDVPTRNDRVTKSDVERFLADREDSASKDKAPIKSRVPVPATPAARRLARELDLDLASVSGSGPRGRVQETDVRSVAEKRPAGEELQPIRFERAAERQPLEGMRRTIAERMQTSFHTAPHIALTVEVDVSRLEGTRARMNALLKETAPEEKVDKVTLTALLVRIVAWALARHPYVNASLIEEEIYLWKNVNVGVATAIDDGLIVPVIHHADRLSVGEINEQLVYLTNKARSGQLSLENVRGGTFTLSNLGMFGIKQFRAIINPPESAILAVGQVRREPVVVDQEDNVEVRPAMSLTLSADHRVIDGVAAARFLSDIVKAVEMPDLLLL
jgi:pyruvate dehydrogenase E2 component (dihydrolipoamide acetyltransferase)